MKSPIIILYILENGGATRVREEREFIHSVFSENLLPAWLATLVYLIFQYIDINSYHRSYYSIFL